MDDVVYGIIWLIILIIWILKMRADGQAKARREVYLEQEKASREAYWEAERKRSDEKIRKHNQEYAESLFREEQLRQETIIKPTSTPLISYKPNISYSSQSSNIEFTPLYPVKNYKTVDETMRECDEYWERHLGMPVSSITNTPDYSSFGIAANTPGIDLAEAQMFDDFDLF